jgi:hypothetical protein
MSSVVKFPYSVSRRAHYRRPRTSKNGTPEERTAMVAQEMTNLVVDIAFIGNAKPDLWSEVGVILSKLNVKGLLPEAVKCLGVFLERSNVAAALARQRQASKLSAMSAAEFGGALADLDEMDRQYISGYMQGIIDARALR